MEDKEILEQFKKGQEEAFFRLLDLYERDVYTLALRISGNAEDARDASQEAWLRIYRGLNHFRGESTLKTWIYRIAFNTSLSELKKKHRLTSLPLDEEIIGEFPEEYGEIESELLNLPDKYRSAVSLKDIYGYPYEEIARIMKISLSSAKVLVHRGRIKLKNRLGEAGLNEVKKWI